MQKKIFGSVLVLTGILFVIISILALVKAFDVFTEMPGSAEGIGYAFGSILFPLLMTVIGRWMIRKGIGLWRHKISA